MLSIMTDVCSLLERDITFSTDFLFSKKPSERAAIKPLLLNKAYPILREPFVFRVCFERKLDIPSSSLSSFPRQRLPIDLGAGASRSKGLRSTFGRTRYRTISPNAVPSTETRSTLSISFRTGSSQLGSKH